MQLHCAGNGDIYKCHAVFLEKCSGLLHVAGVSGCHVDKNCAGAHVLHGLLGHCIRCRTEDRADHHVSVGQPWPCVGVNTGIDGLRTLMQLRRGFCIPYPADGHAVRGKCLRKTLPHHSATDQCNVHFSTTVHRSTAQSPPNRCATAPWRSLQR